METKEFRHKVTGIVERFPVHFEQFDFLEAVSEPNYSELIFLEPLQDEEKDDDGR